MNCPTAMNCPTEILLPMPYLKCVRVCVKPSLQTLSGETLTFSTAIAEDGARLDASAADQLMVFAVANTRGLTYFDVKVFNPTAPSYCVTSVPSLYRRFEKEKRKKYEQKIRVVELCFFVPLVFSTYGEVHSCCDW